MTIAPRTQVIFRKPAINTENQEDKMKSEPENGKNRKYQQSTFAYYFKKLPASTQTVLKRVLFSVILLSGFIFLIYGGPMIIMFTALAAQIKCFHEIITIAYRKYEVKDIPMFRYISVYFLVSANFYFSGENVLEYFTAYINRVDVLKAIANYHRFLSFCMYFIGVIWFVLSLKKKYYRKQFSLLAWTHIILLVVVGQSHLIVKTIFQGLIWFIICITTITANDIMAYICGKFFGKTPLIALSPKKTWEGFIGAGIFTIIIGCATAYFLSGKEYFVCPIEYREINHEIIKITQCEPNEIFKLANYTIFNIQFETYPFVLHSFWLSLFGSVVAPFGGFFASGFKRAFKVKDFGDTIPGHGGIMDRFDCQLVMVTFVNVYISSFIGSASVDKVFEKIMYMNGDDQLELFYLLRDTLNNSGHNLE